MDWRGFEVNWWVGGGNQEDVQNMYTTCSGSTQWLGVLAGSTYTCCYVSGIKEGGGKGRKRVRGKEGKRERGREGKRESERESWFNIWSLLIQLTVSDKSYKLMFVN